MSETEIYSDWTGLSHMSITNLITGAREKTEANGGSQVTFSIPEMGEGGMHILFPKPSDSPTEMGDARMGAGEVMEAWKVCCMGSSRGPF